MKRKLIISTIILISIISALFYYISGSIKRDIESERFKQVRYLNFSIDSALNLVQDSLSLLYKEIGNKGKEALGTTFDSNQDIIDFFSQEKTLLYDFPDIFTSVDVNVLNFNSDDSIFIKDFKGEINLPVENAAHSKYPRSITISFDITNIIENHLIDLIKETNELKLDNDLDFKFKIKSGEEIIDANGVNSDLIVDLNKVFDTETIREYYSERADRDNKFNMSDSVYNKHRYLVVEDYFKDIIELYDSKYYRYLTGLIVIYIVLITAIIVLFYTAFRIHQNSLREKDFTSLISHELKTPLSVIQMGADNLLSGVISEKDDIEYYGDMIKKESFKLQNMINKILTISTSQTSEAINNREMVEIDNIMSEIISQLDNKIRHSEVEIDIVNNSKSRAIICNKVTIISAIYNVIENSIKYGASFSDDKKVHIKVEDRKYKYKDGINIDITDFGPGITRKDTKNIFKAYYRGENMMNLQLSGTGLGLSLTEKIIKQHKGIIELESNLKKATSFKIWLPKGV